MTIPAAFLQASSDLNDLLVTLWLLVVVYLACEAIDARQLGIRRAIPLGIALGALLLSKGTGILFAAPILIWLACRLARRHQLQSLRDIALVAAVAIALNAPHWTRNVLLFGSIFGPQHPETLLGGPDVSNIIHTPAAFASTLLRATATQFASPSATVNTAIEHAVLAIHTSMGWDPNDPRTTWKHMSFSVLSGQDDLSTAAPYAHLPLIVAALIAGLIWRRSLRANRALEIAAVAALAFVLFVFMLKWQPWHNRLLMPLIALLGASCGAILSAARGRQLATPIALALTAALLPSLWAPERPLLGPQNIFARPIRTTRFIDIPTPDAPTQAAAHINAARSPHTVGLLSGTNEPDYLLMRDILDRSPLPPRFLVADPLPELTLPSAPRPRPARLVGPADDDRLILHANQPAPDTTATYLCVRDFGPIKIYLPSSEATTLPDFPAPFFGFHLVAGLDPAEGPYPQWNLPLVRWAEYPATTLQFNSPGTPMRLLYQARRNSFPQQRIVVRLNGQVIHQHAFTGDAFEADELPLKPHPGENELTLEYAQGQKDTAGRNLTVLFSKLQLLDDSTP